MLADVELGWGLSYYLLFLELVKALQFWLITSIPLQKA
jgi:hypothetical protein